MATVVWARGRLRDLEDRYVIGGGGDRATLEKEITDLSLRFGVLCRFTAFVAVDRSEVVNAGGQVHSIVQPVEQPAGWAMQARATGAFAGAALRSMAAPACARPMAPFPAANASESVDSFLMEFDDEDRDAPTGAGKDAAKKKDARAAKGPGLLQQLLDMFRGKNDKAKAASPTDREPYRQRLADALQAIHQHTATDATSRLGALRTLTLEAVFTEWTTAGERDEAVRKLGELVVALRANVTPSGAVVNDLWTRTEAVLQACLTLCGAPGTREGFWK